MRYLLAWILFICSANACCAAALRSAPSAAHWIWCDVQRQADVTGYFRKEFALDRQATSALLRVVGESAELRLAIDGLAVLELGPYAPVKQLDVTDRLKLGDHCLSIVSTSCEGPSAVCLQLDLRFDDEETRSIVTDATWSVSENPAQGWMRPGFDSTEWRTAVSFGPVSDRLLITDGQVGITAVDNYEQWKQALGARQGTDPAKFRLTPGFEIELVRSAGSDEDSWVSLAIDPQGRAVVAKEQRGLLRMTLSKDGRRVTHVEKLNEELEECRGLLFAFGDLFVNANNSKGLYRLRGDGADGFREAELLYASTGGVGHGRNDLALGPDQRIYMIHGDSVDLPTNGIDHTSPFRESRNGIQTREGHLLRIDPDGGPVELLAAGLRNPFGIDFNAEGEAFTYDADAEYDMGSSWYRPTRVNHLVVGGDYGWRGVTKSWPPYFPDHPDNALHNLNIGKGSPTAVKFATRSHFPKRYRDALLILDWAYGRIVAVHAMPRGSSYMLSAETFLKGRPLNVTDLDFAADGALYLVTGGRGTQSAMYRISYVGDERNTRDSLTVQQQARRDFGRRSRQRRRQLESYLHQSVEAASLDDIWPDLSNDDPWIRHAARNVLERIPIANWESKAIAETNPTAATTALLAIARSDHERLYPRVLRRLNGWDLQQLNHCDKRVAIYCYALCIKKSKSLDPLLLSSVAARLDNAYPDDSFDVNRALSDLLAKIGGPSSLAKTIRLMQSTNRQVEQFHYLYVLRNVEKGWSFANRQSYLHQLEQSRHYLGGAGMPDFLSRIKSEFEATLSPAELERLGPLAETTEADEITVTGPRPFVRKWDVDTLAHALEGITRNADLDRGARMFVVASCSRCHRIAGAGTLVGPDLTSVSRRFSRRDLLESIIEPSKVIPEKYRSLQIVTTDGKTYTGQTAPGGDYRSPTMHLATDPTDPFQVTPIAKDKIESQTMSGVSWMPESLLDTFTLDEIFDLITYIESVAVLPN